VNQIHSALAALERGDVRPVFQDSVALAGSAPSSTKPSGIRPHNHPWYWTAFVLAGDPV
jgi:CHAT domain-containing protein